MAMVPLSMLSTVLLLSLLGMSFNIMTLGGIAAAIGLLIDDSIVMIEHIARRAGEPGRARPEEAVLPAAREFLAPLFGSSLATIIIFVPLAFLSGITGAFFKFLSLTMASALVISFILTATDRAAAGAQPHRFSNLARSRPRRAKTGSRACTAAR